MPSKGVLIEGQSEYLIPSYSWEYSRDKFVDIHVPLLVALAQELTLSPHVKWALTNPHPPLHPDCRLFFKIEKFEITSGMAPPEQSMPAVEITIQVFLERLPNDVLIYNRNANFTYDFWLEKDEQIQTMRSLDNCYKKVAREIREDLDRLWLSAESTAKE